MGKSLQRACDPTFAAEKGGCFRESVLIFTLIKGGAESKTMADKFEVSGVEDETAHPLNLFSLLERVAGIINEVQACQQRMEERQLELESNVKTIQTEVLKLAKDHTNTSCTVDKLLEKTRKVGANIKDVRVRLEKQNLRVKKVETTQEELLTKNKFRVVIYQVRPTAAYSPLETEFKQ